MEAKGLKKLGEQLDAVIAAIEALIKVHKAGVECDAPDELEDERADLERQIVDVLIAVYVDAGGAVRPVTVSGEGFHVLTDETEGLLCDVLGRADFEHGTREAVMNLVAEQVKDGSFQDSAEALRRERSSRSAPASGVGLALVRPVLDDGEIEIVEHALELVAFDAADELKSKVAAIGEKLTAWLTPAPPNVERVDFYEVDLQIAVKALAAYRAPWKGGAEDAQRAVLDRLGVKLATALAQLQHRAALALAARPSVPTSLAEVAAAVADPSIPVAVRRMPTREEQAVSIQAELDARGQTFAEALAERRRDPRECEHKGEVIIIGNEETGASSMSCGDCGANMTRRPSERGEYVYYATHAPESKRCPYATGGDACTMVFGHIGGHNMEPR